LSKPSAAKTARQSHRAERRAHRLRAARRADRAEQLATKLAACLDRWTEIPIGELVEERCPFCSAVVMVRNNKPGESDASHALPACELWTVGLLAIGAHSPRVVPTGEL
jgi:hypothetical protein